MDYLSLPSVDEIVSSLAMMLVHFTWQAVVIALVLKFILILSKKQALKLRYYSTVIALSACVLWPTYTFNSFYQQTHSAKTTISQVEFATEEGYLTFRIPIAPGNPVRAVELSPVTPASETIGIDYQSLVLMWILGVTLMLVKLMFDLRQTYRLTRVGVSSVDDEINRIVSQISRRFDIKRKVTVLKSSLVNVPVVIGWFRPTVLLPIAICIGLERHQLELILAHELAHVKRLDFLVNLTQGLIQVLFFYHPCIYWINKVLREEREYICDSMALGAYENTPTARLELAKALLNIEELKEGNLPLVAVAATDGHLKKRIGRIVLNERFRMPSARGLLVVFFGMVFSITTIAVTSDMSAKIQQDKNSTSELINTVASEERKNAINLNSKRLSSVDSLVVKDAVFEKSSDFEKNLQNELVKDKSSGDRFVKSSVIEQVSPSAVFQDVSETNPDPNIEVKKEPIKTNTRVDKKEDSAQITLASHQNKEMVIENLLPKVVKSSSDAPVERGSAIEQTPVNDQEIASTVSTTENLHLALLDAKNVSQFVAPKALITPYPIYPSGAYNNNLEGRVKVDFVIDERGYVIDPQFSKGTPWVFQKEIKSKLRRWRYIPAEKAGEAIAFNSSVFFDFELPQDEPLAQYQLGSRLKRHMR